MLSVFILGNVLPRDIAKNPVKFSYICLRKFWKFFIQIIFTKLLKKDVLPVHFDPPDVHCFPLQRYTATSIKVVHEQSGEGEYERERLQGTALKIY
jgi:hypothetical protein